MLSASPLSFTVRLARDEADLQEACAVRAHAYGHHLPQLREALARPDVLDRQRGVATLICRDKATGRVVGTVRIQRCVSGHLQLEHDVALPQQLARQPRAECTRLAIVPGADPLVRPMLVKAAYLFCVAQQVRWLIIGARSEALVRVYRGLGFAEALGEGVRVPLAHAGDLPHAILAFDVVTAERTWSAAGHGLYPFMVETYHPELQLFADDEDTVPAHAHVDDLVSQPMPLGAAETLAA